MRPGRRPLVAGAAGLVTLILFVGHPNFRHPGLTTRRLSDDADRHGPYVGGRWADGFSPSDRAMLEKFHEAGGYLAFGQARIEEAVLARLVDRGEKLPKELIDVIVEFLELPRWRPAPAKKKE
jgi:hypothetical protein